MPTKGLTPDEEVVVLTNAAGQVKASAVVRLYKGAAGQWTYTGQWGVAVLVVSQKSHFIRIVDIKAKQRFFEQELYFNFSYQTPSEFFHYFEGMETTVGFSFADYGDAKHFASEVKSNYPVMLRAKSDIMANLKPITPAPQEAPSSSRSNPKPRKKSIFTKIFGGSHAEEEGQFGTIQVIGSPTDFKHESHVGWDPETGFQIRNLPESWKRLFQMAGIKDSELTDKDTAKFILNTVVEVTANMPPIPGLPPPTPVSGGLLAGLQSRAAGLKSVEQRKTIGLPNMPDLGGLSMEQEASLANTLAKAMAVRRQDLLESDEEANSNTDSDAWEDEEAW